MFHLFKNNNSTQTKDPALIQSLRSRIPYEIKKISIAKIHIDSIYIERIDSDPNDEKLKQSILKHGLLHPILVISLPDGTFELASGKRRVLALKEIGETEVWAKVIPQTEASFAVIKELNRVDNDLSLFSAIKKADHVKYNQKLLSERVVENIEALADLRQCSAQKLRQELQTLTIIDEENLSDFLKVLSWSHLEIAANADLSKEQRVALLQQCKDEKWSVRNLSSAVKNATCIDSPTKKRRQPSYKKVFRTVQNLLEAFYQMDERIKQKCLNTKEAKELLLLLAQTSERSEKI